MFIVADLVNCKKQFYYNILYSPLRELIYRSVPLLRADWGPRISFAIYAGRVDLLTSSEKKSKKKKKNFFFFFYFIFLILGAKVETS